MTNSQRLATVRACLVRWLADRREPGESPLDSEHAIDRESILIRGEYYCGRRFYTASHHAVWFIEEDELKIYRSNGELECVLSGEEISTFATSVGAPKYSLTESPALPEVIKMPTALDADRDDDSDNAIRRAA